MKNLIVYYSYEGNTEELVKGMKKKVNNWLKDNLK